MHSESTETEGIDSEMRNIIEEARVILPGVQALFGFQTIAVFNDRFEDLANSAKVCHVLALVMVIVAVAMVMTPAIYYRTCHGQVTKKMLRFASRMIQGALCPLAIGLALDMYTVIYLATEGLTARVPISIGVALGTLSLLATLWFFVPHRSRKRLR